MAYYHDYYFPPSKPRAAKGGIKAQSKRGAFGATWWGKRWIETLESFHIGGRLTRGRSYARKGQVLSIDVQPGKVTAPVQGSRSKPYEVTIALTPLASKDWDAVLTEFGEQALYAAKLLAGEMPAEIEEVFTKQKLSLFPAAHRDLKTNCSCPDYSNPCKHIAAVYYLLAEEFDRDPFLVFRLRGMEREEIVKRLTESAANRDADTGSDSEPSLDGGSDAAMGDAQPRHWPSRLPPEPLPLDAAAFWRGTASPKDTFEQVQTPKSAASLPKRLGSFPFWRGEKEFLAELESLYQTASKTGMEVFLQETEAHGNRTHLPKG